MGQSSTFGWLEVDRIAEALSGTHRALNPVSLRFTDLRRMVEALPNFREEPGHPVNEKILEAIQAAWLDELDDAAGNED